jgi:uncharacterized repeat protein (TIGR01451 family)
VALFDDAAGRTRVVASNEVDIYAPRFGAVRSISTLGGYRTTLGTDQLATLDNPQQVARLTGPESLIEDASAAGMQSSQRATNFDADLTASQVVHETVLEGMVGTQLAAEQPGVVEGASLSGQQGVEHTRGTNQAIAWSHDKSAQAVVDVDGGNEVVARSGAQETVTYGPPGGPPGTIQIAKSASQNTAQPGDVIDLVIHYRNAGATAVEKLSLLDSLTPRFEYVPGSASSDRPAQFTAADNGSGSVVLRWVFDGPVQPGQGGVVRFQVRVR